MQKCKSTLICMQCSYILFSVRFRTDSSSVRKKILKNLRTFSEPIPVRFGIFGMDFFQNFSEPIPVRFGKMILTFEQKISKQILLCEQKNIIWPHFLFLTIFHNFWHLSLYLFNIFLWSPSSIVLSISIVWKINIRFWKHLMSIFLHCC